MLTLSICKLVTDLLLYFIAAEFFFFHNLSLSGILLSLIGCGMGYGMKKMHPVFLGFGLLPILIKLLLYNRTGNGLPPLWDMLLLLLPFGYTIYLSGKRHAEEYLGDLSSRFAFYLAGAAALTVVGQIYKHPAYDFLLLFLYAVIGIFTLQMFRLFQSGGLTGRHSGLLIFGLSGICGFILLAASPVIWRAIGAGIQWFYLHTIVPILEWILKLVIFLINQIFRLLCWLAELLHFQGVGFLTDAPAMIQAEAAHDYLTRDVTPEKSIFLSIVSVLVILFFALLLLRILRGQRMPIRRSYAPSRVTDYRPIKKVVLPRGEIGVIRKKYRKMLLKMKKNGAKIDRTSTTDDVALEGLAFYSPEENARIKDEYRKARYGYRD